MRSNNETYLISDQLKYEFHSVLFWIFRNLIIQYVRKVRVK